MNEIHITSISTDALSQATRAAIIDVCIAAHQEQSFQQLFTFIPTGGTHFLAYHEETLVGHAVVTTRWLTANDGPPLKTAYVDAVATTPAYQRQGVGSALMRHLAASLTGYDIGCLETERITYFSRLGWEVWRGPLAGRQARKFIAMPQQEGIMILRLKQTPPIELDGPLVIEYDGRFW